VDSTTPLALVALPLAAGIGAIASAPLGPAAQAAGLAVLSGSLLIGLRAHMQDRRHALGRSEQVLRKLEVRHRSVLGTQRALEEELRRLRDLHRDPLRDARQARIAELKPQLKLRVGERQLKAELVDLTLFDLTVRADPRQQWIPGTPVRVSIGLGGTMNPVGWASVHGDRRPDGLYQLRWAPPLDESAIPKVLWRACNPRDAHRVDVRGRLSAVVHAPSGPRQAIVENLSATGAAVRVGLSRREAGELERTLRLELILGGGDSFGVTCTVRHMSVTDRYATLGVHFDPAADRFGEIQPRLAALVLRQSALGVPVRSAS
jgi:hypothetical protein